VRCLITIISEYSVRKVQEEISEISTEMYTYQFMFSAADAAVLVENMMKKS
jgi:hypothetical protein